MTSIPIALGTAGILGIIYVVLSVRVTQTRWKTRASLGDANSAPVEFGKETETPPLLVAIRTHANFAEYVPIALILLGGIEAAGASRAFCLILALMLIASRVMHPIGMARKAPNPFRAGGAILIWLMIFVASIDALFIAL